MVKFEVPIYGGIVKVYDLREEFVKDYKVYVKEKDEPDDDFTNADGATAISETDPDGYPVYLVGIFEDDVDTLVHECAHLTIHIVERAGFEITNDTSEPFCYLLGDLFLKIQSALETLKNSGRTPECNSG